MSDVRPFRALRPRPDLVARVASPPYDVLSTDEARRLAADNPWSFLHVTRAEIDLPDGTDPHAREVYDRSAENLERLIRDGALVRDERPSFSLYELTMGDHVQRGWVVGASVDEYERNEIRKHELTRRAKEDDRADHMERLMVNAGPVLLTYRRRDDLRALADEVVRREPLSDFTADDGIRHRVWRLDDPAEIDRVRAAFGDLDALYVADGHHRSAAAARVRERLRARGVESPSRPAPWDHFLAVAFPDDELRILGYHRVVRDLAGMTPERLLERIAERFEVRPSDATEPAAPRRFKLHVGGRWYELAARPGTFDERDPVRSLDVSILQDNLLAPILGIEDPRTDERIDFVGGIRGMGELERRCREDAKLAIACHPVTVEQLMAIADSGAIMPPKSTWFEPKLRSGLIVRSLRDA
ncbi:MAG: DUF1015 domain-containing protein [Acidobacteria bacterium]|nr:MAG: DUF1015 domain-containing protein [Acidobacteriota bacterium]